MSPAPPAPDQPLVPAGIDPAEIEHAERHERTRRRMQAYFSRPEVASRLAQAWQEAEQTADAPLPPEETAIEPADRQIRERLRSEFAARQESARSRG